MIGQLEIEKARKYTKDNLGEKFNLRDFHYQVSKYVSYIRFKGISSLNTTADVNRLWTHCLFWGYVDIIFII